AAKRMFAATGLPTPRHLFFRDGGDVAAFVARVEGELGYPCFVKPSNMGSSVGVAKARDRAEVDAACALALRYDEWILAEEEVAVLGDDPPEVSVPGEVVPGDEFYSYSDKYESDAAELLAPAPLSEAQTKAAQAMAMRAFEACRCEAMARVDLFLEDPGRGFL